MVFFVASSPSQLHLEPEERPDHHTPIDTQSSSLQRKRQAVSRAREEGSERLLGPMKRMRDAAAATTNVQEQTQRSTPTKNCCERSSSAQVPASAMDMVPVTSTPSGPAPLPKGAKSSTIPAASSFHRRELPQECTAFSSPEGRKLFKEAMNSAENYMQIYFPLAEQFTTQAEPSFCGLGTLAMCLNALQIDPGRLWKGPWRWFSEELLDCCTPLSVAKEKGISFSEFICLAKCNGALAAGMRANSENLSLDKFRSIVKRSCSSSTEIVVLNYSRKVLGQTGDGHFSPIGGYHEDSDMVLLLDVARFKYPPHWVRLSLVYESMLRIDQSSGLPRGLVVLKENPHATGATIMELCVGCAHPNLPANPAPRSCCFSLAEGKLDSSISR